MWTSSLLVLYSRLPTSSQKETALYQWEDTKAPEKKSSTYWKERKVFFDLSFPLGLQKALHNYNISLLIRRSFDKGTHFLFQIYFLSLESDMFCRTMANFPRIFFFRRRPLPLRPPEVCFELSPPYFHVFLIVKHFSSLSSLVFIRGLNSFLDCFSGSGFSLSKIKNFVISSVPQPL